MTAITERRAERKPSQPKLLELEGVDTSALHRAVRKAEGELIFYSKSGAVSFQLGILKESPGLVDVSEDRLTNQESREVNTDWKIGNVPIVTGVAKGLISYPQTSFDRSPKPGFMPAQNGEEEIHDSIDLPIPIGYGNFKNHSWYEIKRDPEHWTERETQIHDNYPRMSILTSVDDVEEAPIWSQTGFIVVGNKTIAHLAAKQASFHCYQNNTHEGKVPGHQTLATDSGLLLFAYAKHLGVNLWNELAPDDSTELQKNLERDLIENGIFPIMLNRLGLGGGHRDVFDLALVDRLHAVDLNVDTALELLKAKLSKISSVEGSEVGLDTRVQKAVVTRAGGNYNRYLDETIHNFLVNYLGITPIS